MILYICKTDFFKVFSQLYHFYLTEHCEFRRLRYHVIKTNICAWKPQGWKGKVAGLGTHSSGDHTKGESCPISQVLATALM